MNPDNTGTELMTPATLEAISNTARVDMTEAVNNVAGHLEEKGTLARIQERYKNDIGQAEEAKTEVVKLSEGLRKAKEEGNKLKLELLQNSSQREIAELGIDSGEATLKLKLEKIDQEEQAQKQAALEVYNEAKVKMNETHEQELKEVETLLDKYISQVEAGKNLSEIESTLTNLGMESALAEAKTVVENAAVGKGIEEQRLEGLKQKIDQERADLETKYTAALAETERAAKEKRETAKKETEDIASKLYEKLDQADDKMADLEKRLDENSVRVAQLEEGLRGTKEMYGIETESTEVKEIMESIGKKIEADKEMLKRVADRMSTVEAAGAGAVKNLEKLSASIANRELNLELSSLKALADLDRTVFSERQGAIAKSREVKDQASENQKNVVTSLTERIKKDFDLVQSEDGRLRSADKQGLEAMAAEQKAWESVKAEYELANKQLEDTLREEEQGLEERLQSIDLAKKEAVEQVLETIKTAKTELVRIRQMTDFLKNEAVEAFGSQVEPLTDPRQGGYLKRAAVFISGLFRIIR